MFFSMDNIQNNKKLKFKEIELKDKITTKEIKKPIPSYLR